MSTLVFFAVGGTGLRAVEPLLHLCALGLGPDRVRLVMIDPDQTHPAASRALDLLATYQRTRREMPRTTDTRYFHTDIEVAHEGVWSPIATSHGTAQVMQRFSALVDADTMRRKTKWLGKLFDLLYDPQDEQQMPLEKGFRGRPSIGTVFMHRIARATWLRDLMADREAVFFAAGSVFGGTGSSALPVIARVLGQNLKVEGQSDVQAVESGRLGAALVLPFFQPKGGDARASDNGIMPDPAVFALNALGAMPYYTDLRSGYGEMFVLGESVWRETAAAVGGPEQDNGVHHVELLTALAALEFSNHRETRVTSARFWAASSKHKNLRIDDLPLQETERRALRAGLVWVHTLLNHFGDAQGLDTEVVERLRGATWLDELGLPAGDLLDDRQLPAALGHLCRYADAIWSWAGALSDLKKEPCLQLLDGRGRSAEQTPFLEVLANRSPVRKSLRVKANGMEVFAGWNLAAAKRRKQGAAGLLEVMREGSERALADYFSYEEPGVSAPRILLPALKDGNLPALPGIWQNITDHRSNLRRIKAQDDAGGVSIRVGSIPSPWARMLLFNDALTDEKHPARAGVATEMLDLLELLWREGAQEPTITLEKFEIDQLPDDAKLAGTPGAQEFAEALRALYHGQDEADPRHLGRLPVTLVLTEDGLGGHHAVGASSPLTVLFTGVDAINRVGPVGYGLFDGDLSRSIHTRAADFQVYVTSVLEVPPALMTWMQQLREECRSNGLQASQATQALVKESAREHPLPFSGYRLHRQVHQRPAPSRWRLKRRGAGNRPYLVDPQSFDGFFYQGAPRVTLPDDERLRAIADRSQLPGLGIAGEWASPRHHWFTDHLVLLEHPVLRSPLGEYAAHGFARYQSQLPDNVSLPQGRPRFLVPLKMEVFRCLAPAELDEVLAITVRPNGDVAVRLSLELEDPMDAAKATPVSFERLYTADEIVRTRNALGTGSDVAVWPSFDDPMWKEYLVFRSDLGAFASNVDVKMYGATTATALKPEQAVRTKAALIFGLKEPPRLLAFEMRDTRGIAQELGVLAPRFIPPTARTGSKWNVAVDFGTSNTTVCRTDESGRGVVMDLTATAAMLTDSTRLPDLIDAYFMPTDKRRFFFGTAIVTHVDYALQGDASDIPGVKSNIPWSGVLRNDEKHRVFGDLKWVGLNDVNGELRMAAFMRQLLSAIAASARAEGAGEVTVHWSYPGAYTRTQASGVGGMWEKVSREAVGNSNVARYQGVVVSKHNTQLHESACTLAYFKAQKVVQAGHGVLVVLDIGGGTTDIALYSNDRAILFDSVLLGGRNLTGGGFDGTPNPYVTRLLSEVQLRTEPGKPLYRAMEQAELYRRSGQDHLAFSHLVSSKAFEIEQGTIKAQAGLAPFRAQVLYLFGALFYHVGLAVQGLQERRQGRFEGNITVAIAGNGSRYLDWADLRHDTQEFVTFARSCMLAGGAGGPVPLDESLLRLGPKDFAKRTTDPKQEVAKGMLAIASQPDAEVRLPALEPTVGEHFTTASAPYKPWNRLDAAIAAAEIPALRFTGSELEVQRFSRHWLTAAGQVFSGEPAFTQTLREYERFLEGVSKEDLENRMRLRLSSSVSQFGEWRGSVFMVEVETMLQHLLHSAFGGT